MRGGSFFLSFTREFVTERDENGGKINGGL